ncbi:LysR substrate-binding domain-containing protein [Labrys monachus]|uniref:DNA-binding transcriptional LysR family regulator n=1 Tax=Labrys monachus TaxID=217067 RepID=A0ABU0FN41_9HYPH|nr:LysR substrate-binding domain-containing protein [Labrys monachus]MDQ0396034.1 DNA-binding transcriptional LysR family regulator [Labrys monachus]
MTLPPLRLLTVFDTVVRRGGIRQASAALNVSQPAVSQSLRQLEDHLGARLLDRSVRPAVLTEAGLLLHRATVEGLGRIAEAVEEIGRLGTRTADAATIACSVGFATYWLMPRLAGFYDRHPDMAVNVMTTQHGAPQLTAGVDIAVRYGDGSWTDGRVQLLFAERIDPVCSPELAARLRNAGSGIADATLLHVDVDDESWVRWSRYLRGAGLPPNRRAGLHFTNYVQATQAALGGLGIMLGWRSITGDLVREGRLVPFLDAPMVPPDGFHLVTSPRPRSAATCQAVGAWLVEAAAPAPPDA